VSITRSYAVDDDDKRGDRRCYRIVGDGSKGGRNDDSNNSMSHSIDDDVEDNENDDGYGDDDSYHSNHVL